MSQVIFYERSHSVCLLNKWFLSCFLLAQIANLDRADLLGTFNASIYSKSLCLKSLASLKAVFQDSKVKFSKVF